MRPILSFSDWQSLNEQGPWGMATLRPDHVQPNFAWDKIVSALRQAAYHPLGIAASGALSAFAVTLPAVEVAYAILLIDDLVSWEKTGQINWANFIIDAIGLVSGSLLVAPLAAALKPVGLGLAAGSGKSIELVAKALSSSKSGAQVVSLLKKVGDLGSAMIGQIKSAAEWIKSFTDYFERFWPAAGSAVSKDLIQTVGQKTYEFVMKTLGKILPKVEPAKFVPVAHVAGHSAAGAVKATMRDQTRGDLVRQAGGLAEK
jgi:hypothetical protein